MMTHAYFTVGLLFSVGLLPVSLGQQAVLNLPLDGTWRFQLDRDNSGISQRWFERTLEATVRLPGNLPAQGIGDDVGISTKWVGNVSSVSEFFKDPKYEPYRRPGNFKVPFWLQPEKYYSGVAWYQRNIEIPASWRGRRIALTLERPHWQTRVWLDGREIVCEDNLSLAIPHRYDVTDRATPGPHQLTIRVDNSLIINIGVSSHSISDDSQGNWNGIEGRIELSATAPVWLENLQAYPEVRTRSVRLRADLRNSTRRATRGKISLLVEAGPGARAIQVAPQTLSFNTAADSTPVRMEIRLGDQAQLWDEFSPALYRLRIALGGTTGGAAVADEHTVTVGLREISTAGTQFVINGRKLFLRGTSEDAVFPKTGHPPLDVESWRSLLLTARAYGLNYIAFDSYCPPEAAFVAGDELGFYYQIEASSWPNDSTRLGEGRPVDAFLDQETARILKTYGNHPSFVQMSSSNEPGGPKAAAWLAEWLKRYQPQDPRRLFTSGSGWPQQAGNDYHVTADTRIQHWNEGLKSRVNARPPETRTDYRDYIGQRAAPVISHEMGQWCAYPNLDEIPKYTGYLKARNYEIFGDWLRANHMGSQARDFLIASGKLQTLLYKEDIESALRTPGMGGFELLAINDFPGEGTATAGVLDVFWEPKGYVTAAEFSRFCNRTVLLARLDKRVFTTEETLSADLEVSHFGPAPLRSAVAVWRLAADGGTVASGKLRPRNVPVDGAVALGRVNIPLSGVPAPARYKLVVGLEGTPFENDWDVWVYPAKVDLAVPLGVTMVHELDAETIVKLESGQTVFLTIPTARVKGDKKGPVQLGFSSIFWNTYGTRYQPPHTLGILCDPKHPALAGFPTEFHSNWQWWYLVTSAGAMILDSLPPEFRPVVQVIDDWFQARRLGLVFEARVGGGKLLVTSIDLQRADNPVSRQMLASLLNYISGPRFDPATRLSAEQVRGLMN